MELMRSTRPALLLLFAVLREEKELFLENRFLTLTQAVEAFHRHHPRFASRIVGEEEFAGRVASLRAVAKPRGWWDSWLKARIQYAYEPTFRRRMTELAADAGALGTRILPTGIIGRIVDRRNELTHVLDAGSLSDKRHAEIAMLGEKIALLLTGLLLLRLEFDETEAEAALMRNPHHRFVADFAFDP